MAEKRVSHIHQDTTGPRGGAPNGPASPTPARRSRLKWLLWILLGGSAGILIILIVAYLLLDNRPSWYQPLRLTQPGVMHLADQAQHRLLNLRNEAQNPRSGVITWTITQGQVNALLATAFQHTGARTPGAQPRVKRAVRDPFVRFTNGHVTVAASSPQAPGSGVFSITISVQTLARNNVSPGTAAPGAQPIGRIAINSFRLGTLPLPTSFLTNRLQAFLPSLAPSIHRMVDNYAGPQYANSATPQILSVLASALRGKPFPMAFQFNRRRMVIRRMSVQGRHKNRSGVTTPAAFTVVFSPI